MIEALAGQVTRRRLLILGVALLPVTILMELIIIWWDPANRWKFPLGHDFVAFWIAAQLYAEGGLALLYDFAAFEAAQEPISVRPGLLLWLYPPLYLVLILPLGAVSFVVGYLLFTAVNLGAINAVAARIKPFPGAVGWAALIGSPIMVGAVIQGQNGAFFAACLIGGFVLREKGWSWASALVFAMVLAKPQYGPLIPVALIALRDWPALLRVTICCAALLLLATGIFGFEIWPYFVENARVVEYMLHEPGLLAHMPSVWAASTLLGASPELAISLHGTVALMAIAVVWWAFRQPSIPQDLKLATLLIGTLLISPYAYRYDMVITLAGVLLLMRHWSKFDSGSVAKLVLAGLWFWPAFFMPVTVVSGVPTGPLIFFAGLALCVLFSRASATGATRLAKLAV